MRGYSNTFFLMTHSCKYVQCKMQFPNLYKCHFSLKQTKLLVKICCQLDIKLCTLYCSWIPGQAPRIQSQKVDFKFTFVHKWKQCLMSGRYFKPWLQPRFDIRGFNKAQPTTGLIESSPGLRSKRFRHLYVLWNQESNLHSSQGLS